MAEASTSGYISNSRSRQGRPPTAWVPLPREWTPVLGRAVTVTKVLFHPVCCAVVCASEDGCIRVWDLETGAHQGPLLLHTRAVLDLDFDFSGQLLATCSADGAVGLWYFGEFDLLGIMFGHRDKVLSVCFFPSGDYLLSSSRDRTIKMWEVATGGCVWSSAGGDDWVRTVKISGDGNLFASTSNTTVRVWNVDSKENTLVLSEHDSVVLCLAWAPACAQLCAALEDSELGPEAGAAQGVGPFLASGSRDRSIIMWDVGAGLALFRLVGHTAWVRAISFHPEENYLMSTSGDKTLRVWDLTFQRCTSAVYAPTHFGSCLDVHRTARYMVTDCVFRMVKLWECL